LAATVDEPRLTVREVAEIMRVSEKTVRKWIADGRIEHAALVTRQAGWLIPKSEVDRLLRDPS
jgi:excisionase family DNA binding protein